MDAPLAEHILIMCTNETDISSDHEDSRTSTKRVHRFATAFHGDLAGQAIRTLLALGAPETETKADVWTAPRHSRSKSRALAELEAAAEPAEEMHNRENARIVQTILPSAQGIVARHAAPWQQEFP